MSEANREDAAKCIAIARKALIDKDVAKAEKFASKAQKLYPSDEVNRLAIAVSIAKTGNAAKEREQQQEQQGRYGHANGSAHTNSTPQQQQRRAAAPGGGSTAGSQRTSHPQGIPAMRQRRPQQEPQPPPTPDPGTPEQRALISQILKAKDLYAILSVSRNASDADIKKAYRKLALQLHPDKNNAHHADEAFKAVGRSFACLSDPDKRAYYDRTGYESTTEAQAAASAQRAQSMRQTARGPGGMYYEEFDPNGIFNIFFGGMSPGARMYTQRQSRPRPSSSASARAAGGAGASAGQSADNESSRMFLNFIQIMPVLLLILFSWLSSSSKPGFSLTQDRTNFPDGMTTARLDVPFYVSSAKAFEASYPRGTTSRIHMEGKIEQAFLERLQYRCNQEKMARHRGYTFGGNKGRVNREPMVACDEADNMIRRMRYPQYVH